MPVFPWLGEKQLHLASWAPAILRHGWVAEAESCEKSFWTLGSLGQCGKGSDIWVGEPASIKNYPLSQSAPTYTVPICVQCS